MQRTGMLILIVDDSAIARRILASILNRLPGIALAEPARNGEEALATIRRYAPDLVFLDLEMPEMDGFELLSSLHDDPTPVIVTSASADRDQVFRALSLGAFDYVQRCCSNASDGTSMAAFTSAIERSVELVRRLRTVHPSHTNQASTSLPTKAKPTNHTMTRSGSSLATALPTANIVIAIAASTGGPPAITTLLARLNPKLRASIIISQHMPIGFTRSLADRLTRATEFSATELIERRVLRERDVHLIPGGTNLRLHPATDVANGEPIEIWSEADETSDANLIAPSADTSFEQLAPILGPRLCAVVLTGMGQDGARGIEAVRHHGGSVICEKPDTAAVAGMPSAAIATGQVDVVAEVGRLAQHIEAFVARVRTPSRSRRAGGSQ